MAHAYATMSIPDLYRWFADETAPTSPVWEAVCRWVAHTNALHDRLDALPGSKRQPNLFLAALRFHGAPLPTIADRAGERTPTEAAGDIGPALLAWIDDHWDDLHRTILARATQTNEPGRCAVLAPMLAALPQPVALFEVGASAGLCLIPDRYRYAHAAPSATPAEDGVPANPGPSVAADPGPSLAADHASPRNPAPAPLITTLATGTPPARPEDLRVAHRQGLDAHPLRADDPEDARWLRSLVWPGEHAREDRLAAALAVAAADPPPIRRGTLPDDLPPFLVEAVRTARDLEATPVLLHSATLAYLTRPQRDHVVALIRAAGLRWLSFEGPTVVSELRGRLPDDGRPHFVAALDGQPVARCSPHGGWVDWL